MVGLDWLTSRDFWMVVHLVAGIHWQVVLVSNSWNIFLSLAITPSRDHSLGSHDKVLSHSRSENVLKLLLVLLIQGNLSLKQLLTEVYNLLNFWHLQCLTQQPHPNLEDLTDLSDLLLALLCAQFKSPSIWF